MKISQDVFSRCCIKEIISPFIRYSLALCIIFRPTLRCLLSNEKFGRDSDNCLDNRFECSVKADSKWQIRVGCCQSLRAHQRLLRRSVIARLTNNHRPTLIKPAPASTAAFRQFTNPFSRPRVLARTEPGIPSAQRDIQRAQDAFDLVERGVMHQRQAHHTSIGIDTEIADQPVRVEVAELGADALVL